MLAPVRTIWALESHRIQQDRVNALRHIERAARRIGKFDIADMVRQQGDAYERDLIHNVCEWRDRGNPAIALEQNFERPVS